METTTYSKPWTLDDSDFIPPEQIKRLRARLREQAYTGKRRAVIRRFIFEFGLSTGLRATEMGDTKVSDCFIYDGQTSIVVRNGKGGKKRSVSISQSFIKHLKEYIKYMGLTGDDYLLNTERGAKHNRNSLYKVVKKAFKNLGFNSKFYVHTLRHTFASELYRATQNLILVQRQLGHKSLDTTKVYTHLPDTDLRDGMAKLYVY